MVASVHLTPSTFRWQRRGMHAALIILAILVTQLIAAPFAHAADEQPIAADQSIEITIMPGSPLYVLKRLWENIRLTFTWAAARKAAYIAELIGLRAAEMVAVSAQGKVDVAAALARDQVRLLEKAEKVLGRLKETATDLDLINRIEQAAASVMRNLGKAAGGLPASAQRGLDDVGRRLGEGVQQLIGQLDQIRAGATGDDAGGQGNQGQGNQGQGQSKPPK